jgi:hypothetical protein
MFLITYQDRVLYATDLVMMPWDNPEEAVKQWEAEYARLEVLCHGQGHHSQWPHDSRLGSAEISSAEALSR